ncbi:hypothetical protein BZA77DRAFT_296029 [Pyronema omphalodes]|nr:hypothetical protein BZA77DRAFT_296029 [Pyronema omphalodes]
MQLRLLLLCLLSFISLSLCQNEWLEIPNCPRHTVPEKRTVLYYCQLKNFLGCRGWCAEDMQCYNLGYNNDKITSYIVERGCCAFYEDHDCRGKLFTAWNRAHNELGSWHDNKISSFMCQRRNCQGLE